MSVIYNKFLETASTPLTQKEFIEKANKNEIELPDYNDPHDFYSKFTPISILYELERSDLVKTSFNYLNISVEIYSHSDILDSFINQIKFRLYCFKNHIIISKRNIRITFFLSLQNKELGTYESPYLGQNEVNSGVTSIYFSENRANIVIFREEDALKVLIHELYHALDLDSKNYIVKFPFLKEPTLVNEAFVEHRARTLNAIVSAIEDKGSIEVYIKKQKKHNLKIASRVLHYYGFKTIDDLLKNTKEPFKFNEGSNVFAYYILTCNLDYTNVIDLTNKDFKEAINTMLAKKNQFKNQTSLKMTFN